MRGSCGVGRVEQTAPPSSSPAASSDAIAARLAEAIHQHRILPGTKLSEDEVGEVYGVSRTVVRASFQRLAHDHLIVLKRNRGAFVAQPSANEAREVFDARQILEPRTARLAAGRATSADIDRLASHIAAEQTALAAGDIGGSLYLSGEFHVEIARLAGQSIICAFVASLVSRSSLIIALYWQRREAICDSHAHDDLLRAIAAGDGAGAESAMAHHLSDLLSSLDLGHPAIPAGSLREALTGQRS